MKGDDITQTGECFLGFIQEEKGVNSIAVNDLPTNNWFARASCGHRRINDPGICMRFINRQISAFFALAFCTILSAQKPIYSSTEQAAYYTPPPARGDLKSAVAIVRVAVAQVRVECYDKTKEAAPKCSFILGTGFWIDDQRLATNSHVVEAARKLEQEVKASGLGIRLMAAMPYPNESGDFLPANRIQTPVQIAAEDQQRDLAILKTFGTKHLLHIEVSAGHVADGELVATSGFPFGNFSLVTTSGVVASAWFIQQDQRFYLADLVVNHGNSGGPVYRVSDGKVIGMARGFTQAAVEKLGTDQQSKDFAVNSGLSLVIPIEDVVRLAARAQ